MKAYALALALIAPAVAAAHSKLDQPPPVNNSDSNKGTVGPCGAIPPNPVQTQFAANGNLTVSWFETVNHTGWFELRFAENGPGDCTMTNTGGAVEPTAAQTQDPTNRVCPTLLTAAILDPDDAGINQGDPATWKKYSKVVKMPNTTCTNCIVQMLQWMSSGTGAAKTFTPYYSCARVTTQTPPPIPDLAGAPPSDLAGVDLAGPQDLATSNGVAPTARGGCSLGGALADSAHSDDSASSRGAGMVLALVALFVARRPLRIALARRRVRPRAATRPRWPSSR